VVHDSANKRVFKSVKTRTMLSMQTATPSRHRGASSAKVWLIVLLVVGVLGGAGWYALNNLRAQRAEQQAKVDAALAAQREKRIALYGERALAEGVEFRTSGLGLRVLAEGEGRNPGLSDTIRIIYKGTLKDGTVFDEAKEPAEFTLGRLVPGMATGLQLLRPGGRMELFIPPALGYGHRPVAGIPAGSGLIFEVTLVEVK
jgi:FKBP-type peptidyl-prolyl cis-trans isomerase